VLDTTLASRAFGNPSTGVQEGEQVAVRLRVYPNPARDLVMAVGFKGKATIVDILAGS